MAYMVLNPPASLRQGDRIQVGARSILVEAIVGRIDSEHFALVDQPMDALYYGPVTPAPAPKRAKRKKAKV